ncbi:MAG: GtrA family protein [Bacteroidales bacterium]|nr:GtrA family protein [Bacteroidales bacterium]
MLKQYAQKGSKILMNNESRIVEILRFGIVGVLATAIHYGLYILFISVVNANVAYSIGFGVGFISNFFLSNYFTFKTKPSLKKGLGFGVSQGINYLSQLGLLNLFLWLGISKELAPIPVFVVVVPITYLLVRFVLKSDKL